MKQMPTDGWHTTASGSKEKIFYAKEGGDGDDIVTDESWQEIILPEDVECKAVLIQVQAIIVDYNIDNSCFGYLWGSEAAGPGILCPLGKTVSIFKSAGGSLGFIKAATGNKIVINTLA